MTHKKLQNNLVLMNHSLELGEMRCDHAQSHWIASHDLQSPSLDKVRSLMPARELKVLLDESLACEVESRLRPLLTLDPHCQADGNYGLTTLYCDTPRFEVFHRQGRYRLFKFRLRRYGDSSHIYLERKSKQGTRVRKQRTQIDSCEVGRLAAERAEQDWVGARYHRHLLRNLFRPVCLLQYNRVAYFGATEFSSVRLTFDRQIRGSLATKWSLTAPNDATALLPGKVVCEFKYRGSLPLLFKSAVHSLQLITCGVSKYRHCLQTVGVPCF